jgi:BarA-like signal transduction histidine kinase
MAVIIHFPVHARVLAERREQEQPFNAVVLPFAPTRRAKARSRGLERLLAEPQASCGAAVNAPSTRTE